MALIAKHKEESFGIGDKVKVLQRIKEAGKERTQAFEGMVISIKGSAENTSFTVRKIGEAAVGIERIFPLNSPTIEKVELIKKGTPGVRRAKLYYTREKSPREIDLIYARAARRIAQKAMPLKKKTRAAKKKK